VSGAELAKISANFSIAEMVFETFSKSEDDPIVGTIIGG
jgi:hypothetical protein